MLRASSERRIRFLQVPWIQGKAERRDYYPSVAAQISGEVTRKREKTRIAIGFVLSSHHRMCFFDAALGKNPRQIGLSDAAGHCQATQ
jgi:hypothetical protein